MHVIGELSAITKVTYLGILMFPAQMSSHSSSHLGPSNLLGPVCSQCRIRSPAHKMFIVYPRASKWSVSVFKVYVLNTWLNKTAQNCLVHWGVQANLYNLLNSVDWWVRHLLCVIWTPIQLLSHVFSASSLGAKCFSGLTNQGMR